MNKLWLHNWHRGLVYFFETDLIQYVPFLADYKAVFTDLLGYTSDQVQIPNENFAWALFFWRAFQLNDKRRIGGHSTAC